MTAAHFGGIVARKERFGPPWWEVLCDKHGVLSGYCRTEASARAEWTKHLTGKRGGVVRGPNIYDVLHEKEERIRALEAELAGLKADLEKHHRGEPCSYDKVAWQRLRNREAELIANDKVHWKTRKSLLLEIDALKARVAELSDRLDKIATGDFDGDVATFAAIVFMKGGGRRKEE